MQISHRDRDREREKDIKKRKEKRSKSRSRSRSKKKNKQRRSISPKNKKKQEKNQMSEKEQKLNNAIKELKKQTFSSKNKKGDSSSSPSSSSASSISSSDDSNQKKNKDKKKNQQKDKKMYQTDLALQMAKNDQIKQQAIRQVLGYTNENNPYGDTNLGQQFMWKNDEKNNKKIMKSAEVIQQEILIVKQKREERELEKIKLEEEKNRSLIEREEETYQQWVQKEKNFLTETQKLRALIRLNYNMELPIDKLLKICFTYRGKLSYKCRYKIIMEDICKYLKSQPLVELNKIIEESKNQIDYNIEFKTGYENYWDAVLQLATEVIQIKFPDQSDKDSDQNQIDKEFEAEIQMMFEEKDLGQLEELDIQIDQNLKNTDQFGAMDYEYWAQIHKKLKIKKCEVLLKNYFEKFVKDMQQKGVSLAFDEQNQQEQEKHLQVEEGGIIVPEIQIQDQEVNQNEMQNLSPRYLEPSQNLFEIAISEQESEEKLLELRQKILQNKIYHVKQKLDRIENNKMKIEQELEKESIKFLEHNTEGIDPVTLQLIEREKNKPLEKDEEVFDDIYQERGTDLKKQEDVLVRPQYFNRVKMGYDWNKYNQCHFDDENPPPKVVLGYKFNLYYPLLFDKKKAPEYFLEQIQGEPNFLILRFSAGPPYQDVQFKIINREWELSDKFGFKCVFNRSILNLYFNFKRMRYRR